MLETTYSIHKEDIRITCSDQFQLAGTLYKPQTNTKGAIMLAPATGIRRRFYNSFATFLAEQGFGVISFENRGIGDSINGSINSINASLVNWGVLDMRAVLEELKSQFPNQSYHLVGHSAGGQLVGLMENASELKSMFSFASSSGSLSNMEYPFKFSALFFLNFFIPFSNLFFGKTNSQWVGMGEPLPKKVASQWSKWCNSKGYVEADFGKEIKNHHYNTLSRPSMWLYATDDGIANHKNVNDMVRVFPKSETEIVALHPKELGIKTLGHMSFFSSKNKNLWKYALDWLKKNE
ncbi:alpha/beta hydrolase family protein [Sediminitomix flava]|uniref:Putative alpha/beta hydrolase n=1 Tax=Sediminitomix flava TaxID=379075 RepID=A0A315ZE47_SEDFL|nr:alpha/beta fold hydrolase [Sediminitomix flava]PWJ43014.1 putative alpha/beta hydrolase [Sediminitomix flava]